MRRILPAVLASFLALSPGATMAQTDRADLAALVADNVRVDAGGTLVAEGGVEVFYQGRNLRAARIVYDRAADSLLIEGPIIMVDGDSTILIADQAELSSDLTNGVLQSARVVLNRELQMAANQVARIGGRYTQLDNTVASSCKICSGQSPLWEIRARRIVHDSLEKQIYFHNAQFRIAGVPVIYFPRLRMPDPTLARSSGFLMPILRTTSGLGTGLKLPYFQTLGPHRDLTITPYLSTKSAQSVDLRYRQAFATGAIELNGALSRDELLPGKARNYLTAKGEFDLPRQFKLTFDGILVSDPAYLLDYGLPHSDRLASELEVSRVRRNEYISGRLIGIRSIREGEANSRLPTVISDFTYHRRFSGGPLGGEAGLRFQTHSHYRSSSDPTDIDGPSAPAIAFGRDVTRSSVRLDWRRNWAAENGMLFASMAEITADSYRISDDESFGGGYNRLHGAVATEFRWPWVKSGNGGAGHVLEPVAQFVWSPKTNKSVPNEDSLLVEFDEGNLFSLNRFPGSDEIERGARLNLGLSYTRIDPAGWSLTGTFGRVFRQHDPGQFTVASGLAGKQSDWLAAGQLTFASGWAVTQRMVFDTNFRATKSETRFDIDRDNYGISGSYIWVMADVTEDRTTDIQELVFDSSYKMTDNWTAKAAARYDIEANRANQAALGVEFRNECVAVDLSLSRRFTSSTSVKPTTDFGLSVDLVGFGAGSKAGPAAACRR